MFRSRPRFPRQRAAHSSLDSSVAGILRQGRELSQRTDVVVCARRRGRRLLMSQRASWCVLALLLVCALPAAGASREDCERQYKPQTGQPGKDVIWVPTSDGLVARMLKMAAVTAADRVYDLGAGDGKIAIAAA